VRFARIFNWIIRVLLIVIGFLAGSVPIVGDAVPSILMFRQDELALVAGSQADNCYLRYGAIRKIPCMYRN